MIRSLVASGVFRPAAHTPRKRRLKPALRRCLPVLVGLAVIAAGAGLFSDGRALGNRPDIEPIRSVHDADAKQVSAGKAGLDAGMISELTRATKATATTVTSTPAAAAAPAPAPAVVVPPAPVVAPAPPPPPPPPASANWDAIARCETGGNWSMRGSRYSGGLGFANTTWDGFGGREFAWNAGAATREQQIVVAERVYDRFGLSGWGCRRFG